MKLSNCLSALIATVLLTGGIAWADFTFIHSSDTHFGVGENHTINAEAFREITKLDPKPAFVVTTGDICEYGTDAEYEMYNQAVKELGDMPIYPTPGNHDVRWNPRGK